MTPTLNPQIVGQAENAHGAIMTQVLSGTGLNRNRWVALSLTMANSGTIEVSRLTERLADALKIDSATAQAAIAELAAAGLVTTDGRQVCATDSGRAIFDQVKAVTGPIVARAYADVPAEDLQTAARVLTAITAGLNRELG
jgi:DNA-binding MarR family transcriptional regulator